MAKCRPLATKKKRFLRVKIEVFLPISQKLKQLDTRQWFQMISRAVLHKDMVVWAAKIRPPLTLSSRKGCTPFLAPVLTMPSMSDRHPATSRPICRSIEMRLRRRIGPTQVSLPIKNIVPFPWIGTILQYWMSCQTKIAKHSNTGSVCGKAST